MHGKCKIIRLKIIVFWVIGPYSLTGGYYEVYSQDILPPSSDGL
jgi:hypothetical protein